MNDDAKEMNDDANKITCSICLCDETEMDVKIVQCSHKFHRHCIVKWIETCAEANLPFKCPFCNRLLTPTDLNQLVIIIILVHIFYIWHYYSLAPPNLGTGYKPFWGVSRGLAPPLSEKFCPRLFTYRL